MNQLIIIGIAIVFVAFIVFAIVANVRAERRYREQLAHSMGAAGFSVDFMPSDDEKAAAFQSLGPWHSLTRGARGVQCVARHTLRGLQTTLVLHRYMVSSGKSSHPVFHTIAAVPCPASWPAVDLARQTLWHSFASLFVGKDLQVEDPDFNRRFHVNSDDPDFALLLLTPDVQSFCLRLPDHVVVRIGRGAVSLGVRQRLPGESAVRLAEQAAELRRRISTELDAWVPDPA